MHDAAVHAERRRTALAVLVCALVVAGFVFGVLWRQAERGGGVLSFDIYAAHLPNIIYALAALKEGHGLLWNRLQNCGQPFLPGTVVALFYPLNVLFLVLDTHFAFVVIAAIHLFIGGIGSYALCREYGLTRPAALCGAIGFELSGDAMGLALWLPTTNLGVYAWLPLALLCCERILQRPTCPRVIALAGVLTLQLLLGQPQYLLFTYDFIVLRTVWEFVTRRPAQPLHKLAALAVGMALPPLLGAAQFFPMVAFARVSVREHAPATLREMAPTGLLTWQEFRFQAATHLTATFINCVAGVGLTVVGLLQSGQRRMFWFYLLAGSLLAATVFYRPLLHLYLWLPTGSMFRYPQRLLWLTGFCASMLSAFGVDVLARGAPRRGLPAVMAIAAPVVAAGVVRSLSSTPLQPWEWAFSVAIVFAVLASWTNSARAAGVTAVLVVLTANLALLNAHPSFGFARDDQLLYRNADAFGAVRARLTLQDRIYQYGRRTDYALMYKSASVFGLQSIADYEPQTSQRYATFFVRMIDGKRMHSLNEFYVRFNRVPRVLPLFNLVAARFVVVGRDGQKLTPLLTRLLKPIWSSRDVVIYENPAALPRAFYVSHVEVVSDRARSLDQLASRAFAPRRAALVEAPPADGFLGTPSGTGTAEILRDDSEALEIVVDATAPGFLFLSDQDYPGWHATVNGVETPILRADYAFRAVRVPAGKSTVLFRYRPANVWLGAMVSLASWTLVAAVYYRGRRRKARPLNFG
jgi:hypothetical protein